MSTIARSVTLALAIVVTACSGEDADPNEAHDEPVLEVATDTDEPVCMLVSEDLPPEVEELPVIVCDVPHTHQIFATVVYDVKDVYPGVEELSAFAEVECMNAFEGFVGRSPFDSQLSYTWLVPSLDGWNMEDDRDVLCVLADRDGTELTASMQASNV